MLQMNCVGPLTRPWWAQSFFLAILSVSYIQVWGLEVGSEKTQSSTTAFLKKASYKCKDWSSTFQSRVSTEIHAMIINNFRHDLE